MNDPIFSLSTESFAPDKGFPLWRDALYEAGVGSEVSSPCVETFSAVQTQYEFGTAIANVWKSKDYQVRKTKSDCARRPSNHYSLVFLKGGALTARQAGREAEVKPGDCVLRNADAPSLMNTLNFDALTLHIPTKVIEKWIPSPQDVTAIPLAKHSRWGGVLAATLAAIEPASLDQLAVPPQTVVENICSLLALTLGPDKQRAPGRQATALHRFRQMLRERFDQPDFSPAALALAQGVSRRTLHYAFAHDGSSFGAELKALRMEKARQLLDDSRFTARPVADIAHMVGFTHTSHFITCFRQTFGVTPLAYRAIRRA